MRKSTVLSGDIEHPALAVRTKARNTFRWNASRRIARAIVRCTFIDRYPYG